MRVQRMNMILINLHQYVTTQGRKKSVEHMLFLINLIIDCQGL